MKTKETVPSQKQSDLASYMRLLSYLRPFLFYFFLSIVGFAIYASTNVAFVQLLAYIVDSLGGKDPLVGSWLGEQLIHAVGPAESLNRTVIPFAIVGIAFMRGIGSFVGNYYITFVSTNIVHKLRCELFDQLLKMPSQFYDKNSLGHLVAKVTYHVTQVTGAATDAVKVVIREGFTVIAFLAFMLYLNWKLTLIFFLVAPFIAFIVSFAGKRFRKISERIQNSMGDVTHVASEAVQGYRVVRNFGGTAYERNRFQKVSQYNRRQTMKMVVTSSISTPVIQILVAAVMAFLVWILLDPVLMKNMSSGDVIAFISASGMLAKPVRQLSEVNETIQKGLAAAKDIFRLYDEEVEEDSGSINLEKVKGRMEFKNVSFRYGDESPMVLKNISFVVEPGETIALVGRSGSGKSTLASLVPRFYAPVSGEILLDEVSINDLTLQNLRAHIAVVTQQVTLFNDTVRRNIAYGDLEKASDEEVIEAARKAYAWRFIEKLADGLDTVVGDDGVLLSGGQRQRMAIARAFLKDAPLLILDEATSALDTESEKYIQAALEAVVKDKTTFIIAHRLSTIEKADRIFVLDSGEIVEQGTHKELLEKGGTYAGLYRHGDEEVVRQEKHAVVSVETSSYPVAQTYGWPPGKQNLLIDGWYKGAWWLRLLQPVSFLYSAIAGLRRRRIRRNPRLHWTAPVPVIIVGNINLGGTGKTPLVIWLANQLLLKGFSPGIVSRGYKGSSATYPLEVNSETDPRLGGDEAVMIARRTSCPVVVDPQRVDAAKKLLEDNDCDVIISDDGLQHYALNRNIEIVVIDADKGVGNGLCIPAGPLREPVKRLEEVDMIVSHGGSRVDLPFDQIMMSLEPLSLVNIVTSEVCSHDQWSHTRVVHAVAGIGNPGRFFSTLRNLGFEVIEHPYSDHHSFHLGDISFGDSVPVVMTEKDAIKVRLLNPGLLHNNFWYLKVDVNIEGRFIEEILNRLDQSVSSFEDDTLVKTA